jgi:hypothetical protein
MIAIPRADVRISLHSDDHPTGLFTTRPFGMVIEAGSWHAPR